MVRSVMPLADELVLNRKVQGAALGEYTLTPEDQAQMALLAQAGLAAQQAGIEARQQMALLLEVFEAEVAERRLAQPALQECWDRLQQPVVDPIEEDGVVVNQDDVDLDAQERDEAQQVIAPHLIDSDPDENGDIHSILDPEAVAQDGLEREEAQVIVDGAGEEVMAVVTMRKPSDL